MELADQRRCVTGFGHGSKVRSWLVAYNGQVCPKSVSDMVNSLEDSIAMGSTISLVKETQAALTVLEQVGRVPEANQICRDPTSGFMAG